MKDNDGLDSQVMNQILKGDVFPDDEEKAFMDKDIRAFFDELLGQTGQAKSDIIRATNIPRTYGYQILGGARTAHRDYYLLIAIAMKLDLRTTQRLLAITQTGCLHSLVKRDAALMFAINHGYDNLQTYNFLLKLGLPPLEKDVEKGEDEAEDEGE